MRRLARGRMSGSRVPIPAGAVNAILLEDGTAILLENGTILALEAA